MRGAGTAGPVEAAFFDLDKTVIAKPAMAVLRGPMRAGGLLDRRSLAGTIITQLLYLHIGASERRLARGRDALLKLSQGWAQEQVVAIVEESIEDAVEPIIYAEAMDLIEQHHAEGRLVVIVSASPEEIVAPLGRYLGVDETIASRAEVDAAGRYTGAMAFYAYGPYKAQAMKELADRLGVDLLASYAYSDSYTDLPMLEAVGHPVAVNPDRVLGRIARDRSWEVRRFVRPVRLRDRVRDRLREAPHPAPRTAVSMATLALVALAWWLGRNRVGAGLRLLVRALSRREAGEGLSSSAGASPPRRPGRRAQPG